MCLIIAKPKGSTFNGHRNLPTLFTEIASSNRDGWGVMVKRAGYKGVEIAKGLFEKPWNKDDVQLNEHLKGTAWDIKTPEQLMQKGSAAFSQCDSGLVQHVRQTTCLTGSEYI